MAPGRLSGGKIKAARIKRKIKRKIYWLHYDWLVLWYRRSRPIRRMINKLWWWNRHRKNRWARRKAIGNAKSIDIRKLPKRTPGHGKPLETIIYEGMPDR